MESENQDAGHQESTERYDSDTAQRSSDNPPTPQFKGERTDEKDFDERDDRDIPAGDSPIVIKGGSLRIECKGVISTNPTNWTVENDPDNPGHTHRVSTHPKSSGEITMVEVKVPGYTWCLWGFKKATVTVHYTDVGSPQNCT